VRKAARGPTGRVGQPRIATLARCFVGTLRPDQLGLTATPARRDGQQPIIFMQCGPIRHTAAKPEGAPQTLEVTPRFLSTAIDHPPLDTLILAMPISWKGTLHDGDIVQRRTPPAC
jgi:superfamily II DNA or RNA helicase